MMQGKPSKKKNNAPQNCSALQCFVGQRQRTPEASEGQWFADSEGGRILRCARAAHKVCTGPCLR